MTDQKPTVFYDGACPLCRREIAFYQKRAGAERIDWIDVSEAQGEVEVAPGLSKCDALARFHVRDEAGRLISGGRAFAVLWRALPGFRWAGRMALLPPLSWIIDPLYDLFLKLRPALQRLAARREAAITSRT